MVLPQIQDVVFEASVGQTVTGGPLLIALAVAVAAGLVSFLSPCVLPLLPGYLSYVTGLAGADLNTARRGRLLVGTSMFVLGFTVVFVSFGALFGAAGAVLLANADVVTRILGGVTIVLGLLFMGAFPRLQRQQRIGYRPAVGVWAAPVLGVVFGLSWTPCIGPTLAAVQTLALDSASAQRGALLTFAYSIGLGLPFLMAAVAFRRALGLFGWCRRHSVAITRAGGGMLIALGVLLVTGLWSDFAVQLRILISGFTPVI